MADGLARFSVDVKPTGQAKVVVNDQDISDAIMGLNLQVQVGQPPVLTLQERGGGGLVMGDGIVRVAEGNVSPKEAVLAFLGSVNWQRLDEIVMTEGGFADPPMQTAMEVLMRWADALD